MTCSMWSEAVKAFIEKAGMSPTNAKIADDAMMLVADAPAACTTEEKDALMALLPELEGLSEDLTDLIDGFNADAEGKRLFDFYNVSYIYHFNEFIS